MAAIRKRQENPSLHLELLEIHLPDGDDVGTGDFSFRTKEGALRPTMKPGASAIVLNLSNAPRFQLTVPLDLETRDVAVSLGAADGTPLKSSVWFVLPAHLDHEPRHDFGVRFAGWRILSMTMDGAQLPKSANCL